MNLRARALLLHLDNRGNCPVYILCFGLICTLFPSGNADRGLTQAVAAGDRVQSQTPGSWMSRLLVRVCCLLAPLKSPLYTALWC